MSEENPRTEGRALCYCGEYVDQHTLSDNHCPRPWPLGLAKLAQQTVNKVAAWEARLSTRGFTLQDAVEMAMAAPIKPSEPTHTSDCGTESAE